MRLIPQLTHDLTEGGAETIYPISRPFDEREFAYRVTSTDAVVSESGEKIAVDDVIVFRRLSGNGEPNSEHQRLLCVCISEASQPEIAKLTKVFKKTCHVDFFGDSGHKVDVHGRQYMGIHLDRPRIQRPAVSSQTTTTPTVPKDRILAVFCRLERG
jgi:hypothetical protein